MKDQRKAEVIASERMQLLSPLLAERHRALRIHLEIEQETHFLQHFANQQMRLIYDDNVFNHRKLPQKIVTLSG